MHILVSSSALLRFPPVRKYFHDEKVVAITNGITRMQRAPLLKQREL